MKGLSAEPIWRKMGQSIAWVAWGGGSRLRGAEEAGPGGGGGHHQGLVGLKGIWEGQSGCKWIYETFLQVSEAPPLSSNLKSFSPKTQSGYGPFPLLGASSGSASESQGGLTLGSTQARTSRAMASLWSCCRPTPLTLPYL